MFNKDMFKEVLIKARGNRTNEDYSRDSGVSRAYISNYINAKRDKAPSVEILQKLADASENNIKYEDLMIAAGHLPDELLQRMGRVNRDNQNSNEDVILMLNERLRSLRIEADLTRDELANKINVSYSAISKYETNVRFPDQEILKRIADFFNVSVDYLLGRTHIKDPGHTYTTEELLGYLTPEQKKEFLDLGIEGIVVRKNIKDKKRIQELLLKAIRIVKIANDK